MKITLNTVFLVFFVSFFSIVYDTQAQSIPLLSDPIKIREIEIMSNKLDMTNSQREAILEVYDRYLEDFARTRLDKIKDFEDAIAEAAETLGFMQFNIPERALVEELIRKAQRAMKAIHRSDNLFFEEVTGMLSEKQRKTLGRARIARELEAYEIFVTELLGSLNRGARSQIRKLYERIDAEPNTEVEEALDVYDQRYLREVKEGFDAVVETIRLTLDQIDELGVRDMDHQALMMRFMADPEAIEDLKRRGDILLKPIVDQAYEISQLNWKTWKKIDAMLAEEEARKLQLWYFSKSFYDAVRGGKKIEGYLDRALSMKELSEGQRIDLEAIRESFRIKWAKKTKNHADILEKSRKIQTIAIMSGEVTTEFDEKLANFKSDRSEYIDATESRIDGILGKQLVHTLKEANNKKMSHTHDEPFAVRGDGSSVEVQVVVADDSELTPEEIEALKESGEIQVASSSSDVVVVGEATSTSSGDVAQTKVVEDSNVIYGDESIPRPIAPKFPSRAAAILDLDENGEMIIDAVYDEYRNNYNEVKISASVASKEIQEDGTLSDGAKMRKSKDARSTAEDAVATLDTIFFDDLATITRLDRDDINLKMLENHRDRQRASAPEDPFGWRGGEGDTIDLVGLYVMSDDSVELHVGLSEKSIQAIRKAMQEYHGQVVDPHDSFVNAVYELNHIQDAMLLMEDSKQDGRTSEAFQARLRDAFTSIRDSKRALLLVNQTVMENLLEQIPESEFWKVRMEFVSKAYPDVFKKSSDLTKMLTAANEISSLDASQQTQLETLTSKYRYDYWNICESMIENHQSNAAAKSGDEFMNKEDIHRQLRLETLRFERKELNDRLCMRLRMVLNEEQVKEVPNLRPSVAAADEW